MVSPSPHPVGQNWNVRVGQRFLQLLIATWSGGSAALLSTYRPPFDNPSPFSSTSVHAVCHDSEKGVGCKGCTWVKSRALASILQLGVQKYTFGVNWVSNSFSSHCIIHKNMDIRVSKISNRVSKRYPDTPLAKGLVKSDYITTRWGIWQDHFLLYIQCRSAFSLYLSYPFSHHTPLPSTPPPPKCNFCACVIINGGGVYGVFSGLYS